MVFRVRVRIGEKMRYGSDLWCGGGGGKNSKGKIIFGGWGK